MSMLTAIELGTSTLTAVTVQDAGILRGGTVPLAAVDAESVRVALKACGVTETRAVLVVPRGQAILREFELPQGAPEEIVAMARFQVEKEMPLSLDRIRYSYVETGREQGKVRIQVAAVPHDVLDPAIAAVEGAGVRVSGVYVSSFGLLWLYREGGRAALVEVAGGEAEILIVDGGRMIFSRTAPPTDTLGDEIERTLLSCQARWPGEEVNKIVVAGEGAAATKLAAGLRERLAREVVQVGPGDLETAAAAGICIGLLQGTPIPDLLHPPSAVRKFSVTRRHRVIGAAALTAVLLVVWAQVALSNKENRLRVLQAERAALKPKADRVALMARQTDLAQQWYRDRHSWIHTFAALRKSFISENLWITNASFEDTGTVRIVGKAKDGKNVSDFVAALTKMDYFRDKDILLDSVRPVDKGDYRNDFTVIARPKVVDTKKARK